MFGWRCGGGGAGGAGAGGTGVIPDGNRSAAILLLLQHLPWQVSARMVRERGRGGGRRKYDDTAVCAESSAYSSSSTWYVVRVHVVLQDERVGKGQGGFLSFLRGAVFQVSEIKQPQAGENIYQGPVTSVVIRYYYYCCVSGSFKTRRGFLNLKKRGASRSKVQLLLIVAYDDLRADRPQGAGRTRAKQPPPVKGLTPLVVSWRCKAEPTAELLCSLHYYLHMPVITGIVVGQHICVLL